MHPQSGGRAQLGGRGDRRRRGSRTLAALGLNGPGDADSR
ncbi:hypothetical protein AX27061_0880 [Achromobacter xylosoxidans NBRC 15126 = ATCC 27061]|nr:hypothetical protein AX27061_0880 [Achromobacter xylosoxidans NBRC 15126 = ATCC 27061]